MSKKSLLESDTKVAPGNKEIDLGGCFGMLDF